MHRSICLTTLAALLLTSALTACSSPASPTATPAPVPVGATSSGATSGGATGAATSAAPTGAAAATQAPAATQAAADTGGETGSGVEASSMVTYGDAAQGFSIGHPATWTQDPAVTSGVRFAGGDDSLTLAFVSPPQGTDAMTYAKNDVAALSAAFPGFKQLSLAASTEVANAIVLGFEANGTSAVTGKAFTAHDERYYLPLADGRLALLTMTGPTAHYDREGFRDIALTVKMTR